jgi:DNA-binding XRE family transcriptional regulator
MDPADTGCALQGGKTSMPGASSLQSHSGKAAGPPVPANAGTMSGAQRWTTALDGLKLRHLRRQHGLSQETLADRAGVSLTTMARLERKRRSPCRTYTLARLAAALGERPASLSFTATLASTTSMAGSP